MRSRTTGALLALSLLATSCAGGEGRDVGPVMAARFDNRVAALTENSLRQCRQDILDAAVARADSLLLDRARRMRRIEGRPPRPHRPGAPPVRELSAPLPLRPLFPFEIRFDTLLRDSLLRDSLRQDSLLRLELSE